MRNQLFINGEWMDSATNSFMDVVDPANGTVVQKMAAGGAEDVDRAVKAARHAFDHGPWSKSSAAERATVLRRIAELVTEQADNLARLEVIDNGKPMGEASFDIGEVAGTFTYYADLIETQAQSPEEKINLPDDAFETIVVREPLGVVGAIIPWNFPMLMAAWKVAPALAAGCTVVLKPSELTSMTALELAAIATEAGLPPGVLNVVTGDGPSAGQPLIEHDMIDKLAFTGSDVTGEKVMQAAASGVKNVSLELGGKSPLIIFEDSEMDAAVEWTMFGIFWNQGEICTATSRVLVERGMYNAFLVRLAEEAGKIKIGNGFEEGVLMGPLVSQGQKDKVIAAIEKGKADGACVYAGGGTPEGMETGCYVAPTILSDMSSDSTVWTDEIFGPVVCVMPFDTEEEAITLANDSRFGLGAGVMTADATRAKRVAHALRAGIVWINCSQPAFIQAPWGGYKRSGIGRELGPWGLSNFQETKQITSYVSDAPWGWYLQN